MYMYVCVCVCLFPPPKATRIPLPSPFSWGDYGYDGYGYDGYGYDDGYGGSLRTGWNVIYQLFLHFPLFSSVFEKQWLWSMLAICSFLQYVVVVVVLDFLVTVVVGVAVIDLFCLSFFHLFLQLNRLPCAWTTGYSDPYAEGAQGRLRCPMACCFNP